VGSLITVSLHVYCWVW